MKYRLTIFFLLLFALCLPLSARAALLYFAPSRADFTLGETFLVDIRIDTQQECFNAVETTIVYPADILEAVGFNQGNSILSIWAKPPVIDQAGGLISFAGGVPGGYCGDLPGAAQKTNILGKIIFKATQTSKNSVQLLFRDSQILLNDGLGTPASVAQNPAFITISAAKPGQPSDQWQQEIKNDQTPPEQFQIQLGRDPALFDGEYFIAFSTTDKQTGVDYYEVKEGENAWQRAQSPYQLKDQRLKSIIKAKAVDKAGNEQIATLEPLRRAINWGLIFLALAVLAAFGFFLASRKKRS
ncbi:MAG: cohesin domain-containing protein [bacterium]